jgi:hypothetical protein
VNGPAVSPTEIIRWSRHRPSARDTLSRMSHAYGQPESDAQVGATETTP